MNILENYVTNITYEREKFLDDKTKVYEIICDVNCYGCIEKQKHIILSFEDYKMVKENGYYLA